MQCLTDKHFTYLSILVLSFASQGAKAQNYQLIKSLPAKEVKIVTDYLANLYLIENYRLSLYDKNGNSSFIYEDYSHGKISSVDVSDPLKILVYYEDYMHLKVLDKTLSEIGSYNLNDLGYYSISALAHARDDNFWVFDNIAFRLKKMDAAGTALYSSEKFNLLFKETVQVSTMLDYENFVYLNDPKNGIYVFDRFGTYQKRIPLLELNSFQIIQNKLIYFKENSLFSYDLLSFKEEQMPLPEWLQAKASELRKDRVYVVESDKVSIFSFK
ncbi:MAG: hypothetical protein R2772_10455 [Chitinophagales bacterium]